MDRSQTHASITDLETALAQAEEIIKRRRVNVSRPPSSQPLWRAIEADTICIHSDSPIALDLAVRLRRLIEDLIMEKDKSIGGAGEENFRFLALRDLCEPVSLPRYGRQDLGYLPRRRHGLLFLAAGQPDAGQSARRHRPWK